jgi:Flp pilus assembly pilin Flp
MVENHQGRNWISVTVIEGLIALKISFSLVSTTNQVNGILKTTFSKRSNEQVAIGLIVVNDKNGWG